MNTRLFQIAFHVIIGVLSFMSLYALYVLHWKMFSSENFKLSLTADNAESYLSRYGDYKSLFTLTVATIAAYFGLQRLKVAADANRDKIKSDYFNEWKTVLDVRTLEIEKQDPLMRREFIKVRHKVFLDLYDMNFAIQNKDQLVKVFKHFKPRVDFFETQNEKNIQRGGVYPSNQFTYTFLNFHFLFAGCLDEAYSEMYSDLLELYCNSLSPDRIINEALYSAALKI